MHFICYMVPKKVLNLFPIMYSTITSNTNTTNKSNVSTPTVCNSGPIITILSVYQQTLFGLREISIHTRVSDVISTEPCLKALQTKLFSVVSWIYLIILPSSSVISWLPLLPILASRRDLFRERQNPLLSPFSTFFVFWICMVLHLQRFRETYFGPKFRYSPCRYHLLFFSFYCLRY